MKKTITFSQNKCSKCGKTFEAPGKPFPGKPMYCRECTRLIVAARQLQTKLITKEFSIEKEDEHIAKQIYNLLVREGSEKDEKLIKALTEELLKDEKRRKRILKKIRKLQKK